RQRGLLPFPTRRSSDLKASELPASNVRVLGLPPSVMLPFHVIAFFVVRIRSAPLVLIVVPPLTIKAPPVPVVEPLPPSAVALPRSEEHTSELQSPCNLV